MNGRNRFHDHVNGNDVRNHADHGEFDEYTESDVRNMLTGVTDLLGTYMQ